MNTTAIRTPRLKRLRRSVPLWRIFWKATSLGLIETVRNDPLRSVISLSLRLTTHKSLRFSNACRERGLARWTSSRAKKRRLRSIRLQRQVTPMHRGGWNSYTASIDLTLRHLEPNAYRSWSAPRKSSNQNAARHSKCDWPMPSAAILKWQTDWPVRRRRLRVVPSINSSCVRLASFLQPGCLGRLHVGRFEEPASALLRGIGVSWREVP